MTRDSDEDARFRPRKPPQVPSSWRSLIEDPSTLKIFLDFYAVTKPPLSSMSLECLVRLASVRRSLFTNETERSKFLNALVNGTRDILQSQMGLSSHTNYHEYCRLLGRLKTNYQLAELVRNQPPPPLPPRGGSTSLPPTPRFP